MNNLAVDYTRDGKYALAEPLLVQVMETRRKLLGEEDPATLLITMNLAGVYARQGKLSEADSLDRKALETETRVLGPENPLTLTCEFNLAAVYQLEGKYAQAEPLFVRALTARTRVLGSNHPDTLRTLRFLARDLIDEGKFTEAEPNAQAAMAGFKTRNPDGWEGFYSQCLAGESLAGEKKYDQAEPLLTQGYEGMAKRAGSIPAWERSNVKRCGEWDLQLQRGLNRLQKSTDAASARHLQQK
jgi:tetratricopeptide (TPR) repeat protein